MISYHSFGPLSTFTVLDFNPFLTTGFHFLDEAVEVIDENAQSGGNGAVASNGSIPLRNSFDALRLNGNWIFNWKNINLLWQYLLSNLEKALLNLAIP